MAGHAEQLFQILRDEESIERLIEDAEAEALHLDFKQFTLNSSTSGWNDTRSTVRKALGGFANADGGVLVFGIAEPMKGSSTRSLKPAAEYSDLEQKINENISRLTAPSVPNVVTKKLPSTRYPNQGYVAVLIPKSDITPHQDIERKVYYRRSGESFKEMDHFEIADLFNRRPFPSLTLIARLERDVNSHQDVWVRLLLRNKGRGIAKFPFVGVDASGVFKKKEHHTPWLDERRYDDERRFALLGGVEHVIHSDISVPLTIYRAYEHQLMPVLDEPEQITFAGTIACEGMPSKKFRIQLDRDSLLSFIGRAPDTRTEFEAVLE